MSKVIPLTTDLIKTKYRGKNKNHSKIIKCYVGQVDNGNNKPLTTKSKEFYTETIIIGCNLIQKWGKLVYPPKNGPIKHEYARIHLNWLDTSTTGPYKKTQTGKCSNYYYLPGYIVGNKKELYTEFQICSGPLNAISSNCISEVNYYVVE